MSIFNIASTSLSIDNVWWRRKKGDDGPSDMEGGNSLMGCSRGS